VNVTACADFTVTSDDTPAGQGCEAEQSHEAHTVLRLAVHSHLDERRWTGESNRRGAARLLYRAYEPPRSLDGESFDIKNDFGARPENWISPFMVLDSVSPIIGAS
jgi:hypothetical protein